MIKRGIISQLLSGFDLSTISDLYCWLDAGQESFSNGNTVATATDRSGNGNDFTGTLATYVTSQIGGKPAYRLTSNQAYLSGPKADWNFLHESPNSVYMVLTTGNIGLNEHSTNYYTSTSPGPFNRGVQSEFFYNNTLAEYQLRHTVSNGGFSGWDVVNVIQAISNAENSTHLLGTRSILEDTTSPTFKATFKGSEVATQDRQNAPTAGDSSTDLIIGSTINGDDSVDYLAEFIVYDRYLTDAENTQVIDYLTDKYGL
jgi:hypothetical protein